MEILILLILTHEVGGTSFTGISNTTIIIEMDKAQEVIADAKRASQKAMDKDEIQKLWDAAQEVLGASVQVSSQVIE